MNNLSKLNDTLFDQLNRLSTLEGGKKLSQEIERSKAVSQISRDIISNAKLALEAQQFKTEFGITAKLPTMIAQDQSK